jgi:DNA-binding GntR family transcriptional regulator
MNTISRGGDLTPADAVLLPEHVYQELRKAILNGVFAPGQVLRQVEVASRLGVSRSPLREALPRLEAEGIVVSHPRRGYTVATLDPDEVGEAFDLRRLLETELARRSIVKRNSGDIARVYSVLDAMSQLAEQPPGVVDVAWFELNTKLHKALLEPAGRPHHLRALENSCGLIESYIRTEVRLTGDIVQAQQEHTELAQAFVSGDPDEFVRLIQQHSKHTRDRLLRGLQNADRAPLAGAFSSITSSRTQ